MASPNPRWATEMTVFDPESDALIGHGPAWRRVVLDVGRVAPSEATVLIRGETGTGKELLAWAIHRGSPRRGGPFVAVNCGSLSGELVSSELFGHERGAFTGALQQRTGRVEAASGGTLFLDEIGDLIPDLQVRLLRFLQAREFERVGGTETLRADVRVVAATHRDLDRLRSDGRFRDDLFYRLNVFPIRVPPLRERKEDIGALLDLFVRRYSRRAGKTFAHIDRQSILRCEEYPWPGNVRELENLVERAVILCPEPVFTLNPFAQAEASAPGRVETTLDAVIRAHLVRALKLCHGKIYGADGAARLLGLKPSTLQSKMKRLGIRRDVGHGTSD
jgi:formate hydrogenlyase transcriptional activator